MSIKMSLRRSTRGQKRKLKNGDKEEDDAPKNKVAISIDDLCTERFQVPQSCNVGTMNPKSFESKPDEPIGEEPVKGSNNYYDFSSIIESQKELTDFKQQMVSYDKEIISKDDLLDEDINSDSENVYEMLELCEKDIKSPINREDDKYDNPQIPSQVEIVINKPEPMSKAGKKTEKLTAFVRKEYNEKRRSVQYLMHKVNLLCLLSHGFYLNDIANSEEISALSMSLIPSDSFFPPKLTTVGYVEKLIKWFNKQITVNKEQKVDKNSSLNEILIHQFSIKETNSFKNLVLIFVALTRALGLKSRIILSLKPISLRPPSSDLMKETTDDKKSNEHKNSSEDDDDDEDFIVVSEQSSSYQLSEESQQTKKPESKSAEKKKNSGTKKNINKSKLKTEKKNQKSTTKNNIKDRRVISSDDDDESSNTAVNKITKSKQGIDVWAEVYIESDEKWISVDVIRNDVDCITKISTGCSKPIAYVLSWDNNNYVKDLTKRYAPQWLTSTQKQRINANWWDEAIAPWAPPNTKMERNENKELNRLLIESPFPTAISDYKGHPYYALQRHLLKFEAIHPPDAKPLGFCKKEAIYSRHCVVELHTKESWMREGKVVRLTEEPYKIVKARPKHDRASGKVIKDLPLNLYGSWQVVDYIPPPALDGKVPRNKFGNIELYKPSMLPLGTVHLQVPGIMKIAKRLDIDCAPAVVGWDFHGGVSHPMFDGVVVCKEFQDTLLDLWNKEVDESATRFNNKTRKRAISNWKKLARLIIVKRRLERKYKFNIK